MHALIDESLHIWDRFKQFPQFSQEAECHIEGAMQDPAEPPSAADAEPPEAPDAEPPLLADLAQEFLEAPEAPEAQADTFWNDWPDLTEQFEETPEAPPGPRHHQNMLSQQNFFMKMPTGMIGNYRAWPAPIPRLKRSRFQKLSHHNLHTSTVCSTSSTNVKSQRITGDTTRRPKSRGPRTQTC